LGEIRWLPVPHSEASRLGLIKSGELKVETHPHRDPKQPENVIYRKKQSRRYLRKSTRKPLLLKEEQLVLVSKSPSNLKRYKLKPKNIGKSDANN
jgi:hypothetical protein